MGLGWRKGWCRADARVGLGWRKGWCMHGIGSMQAVMRYLIRRSGARSSRGKEGSWYAASSHLWAQGKKGGDEEGI